MIEKLTALKEIRHGSGRPSFEPRMVYWDRHAGTCLERATGHGAQLDIGAKPETAEAIRQAFGEIELDADRAAVRILRSVCTETHIVTGSRVRWRGADWTVDERVETSSRTAYALILTRADG